MMSTCGRKRGYRTELVGNAALESSLWNEVQKRHITSIDYGVSTLGALLPNADGGDRRLRVSRRVRFEPRVFQRAYRTEGH